MLILFKIILGAVICILFFGLTLLFISVCVSAKYDYILEKDENGNWVELPVCHPCGEPIDEEFIKLWHERERQFREDMKKV